MEREKTRFTAPRLHETKTEAQGQILKSKPLAPPEPRDRLLELRIYAKSILSHQNISAIENIHVYNV